MGVPGSLGSQQFSPLQAFNPFAIRPQQQAQSQQAGQVEGTQRPSQPILDRNGNAFSINGSLLIPSNVSFASGFGGNMNEVGTGLQVFA